MNKKISISNIFREVKLLQREGKLHKKLINSLRIQFVISAILAIFVIFNILFRTVNPLIAIIFLIVGFMLGLVVFSRINAVGWNEEEETVQSLKMDKVGYATIALYIVFEISLRKFLISNFPVTTTALLLATICGTLTGRIVASVIKIHRIYSSKNCSCYYSYCDHKND